MDVPELLRSTTETFRPEQPLRFGALLQDPAALAALFTRSCRALEARGLRDYFVRAQPNALTGRGELDARYGASRPDYARLDPHARCSTCDPTLSLAQLLQVLPRTTGADPLADIPNQVLMVWHSDSTRVVRWGRARTAKEGTDCG